MKKIGLFLGCAPHDGGAFQYSQSILDAVAALPGEHFSITVAYLHPAWANLLVSYRERCQMFALRETLYEQLVKGLLRFGLPVFPWRVVAPYIHPFTRKLLARQCDIWLFPAQDVWTYAIPVSSIGVIHDLMHRYERQFPEVSAFGKYYRRELHYRRICRYTDIILVDSRVGKQHVIESYPTRGSQVHVLPFVPPKYIYSTISPTDLTSRFQLPKKFIFYPAQFWLHKNHKNLLHAMALAIPYVPDLQLVLVGSQKNGYQETMKLVNQLGLSEKVHVLGYVSDQDMSILYRQARALVMPTFFGPTNIPPLEAFACGCPVAVSDIYAMPEQVGDAALLFDPNSPKDIADTIIMLWRDDNLCQSLREAGIVRSQEWDQSHFNLCFKTLFMMLISL